MRARLAPRRLRARIILGFAVGALLVSAVLVTTTWLLARGYLLDQREHSVTRQAFADANVLSSHLATAGTQVGDVLGDLVPSGGAAIVVHDGDAWFSSTLDAGARDIPAQLRDVVQAGSAATERISSPGGPRLVVGVPVRAVGVEFYEIADLEELQQVLRTLAAVLAAGGLIATAAGAAFGTWASGRVVQPLEQVAAVATSIAGGDLTTRLAATEDPDLLGIVASFNSMVDALAARIERDARFVGDVSHELRSPLTSVLTSVEVLGARRDQLPGRAREALALVEAELARFRRTVDDLLELAHADSPDAHAAEQAVSLTALAREVLARTGRPAALLQADAEPVTTVSGDKGRLERAVTQLLDNADRHAGGPDRMSVRRRESSVVVTVEDRGPGVELADRDRIFERFTRGSRSARRSLPGAGLGLAIVAETAARHGGAAWCADRPGGGARFVLSLPATGDHR